MISSGDSSTYSHLRWREMFMQVILSLFRWVKASISSAGQWLHGER